MFFLPRKSIWWLSLICASQSIKAYSETQDEFNWNYGIAKAATGCFQEAEEALLLISNERFRSNYYYQAWLSHCYIMSGKANLAWDLHLCKEDSDESFRSLPHWKFAVCLLLALSLHSLLRQVNLRFSVISFPDFLAKVHHLPLLVDLICILHFVNYLLLPTIVKLRAGQEPLFIWRYPDMV